MIDTNEIKKRLTCIDYLSKNGIHISSGRRCVSPLRTGAKNPTSFYCDDDFWYDFGSGTGGDVIDLAAQLKYNGDVGEAIRGLASELGIKSDRDEKWKDEIQNLCNRTAAYHKALTPEDYRYLSERGLSKEDVERLMIGRVTDGYLKGRLFLPYFKNGAVVYYATRAMPNGSFDESKYMKAKRDESPAYQHTPWGLHTLNRRNDILIISEGYFDAVSWEKEGYSVISPITGSFSKEQWPEVISACHMFPKVLIIFDNDAISHAGEGFTNGTAKKLFQNKIQFVVSHTPHGIKDVNDYYTQGGSLQALVDSAEDGLRYMAAQYTDSAELKKFIMSINRYTDPTAIANALFQPILEERFAPAVLKSIQKASESAPTESDIADEVAKKHNIMYVDKVGFYEWNGRIWNKISEGVVKKYIDKVYGKRFSTSKRVNAVCNLISHRYITDVAFDRNPVLTFQNGTLEIETGNFRDFSQNDYCSIIMDYDYNPEATCPTWEHFIEDVIDGEPRRSEMLQFIAGYTLFPNCKHQKVFILMGSGGNGKSVYLEIIQKLFGDSNVTHIEPTGLAREFERIRLKDSLLNIGSDINSDFSKGEIREWLLKVADGTSIQACYKGMTHIDFIPRCKLVFACNALPTAEIINGLNRRMQFVDFPCQYVEDPDPNKPKQKKRDINIIEKLSAEMAGIFNWTYTGYKTLCKVGYFTDTPEQEILMRQFKTTSDPVVAFCEDYDHSFVDSVSRDDIYCWYTQWCEDTGHKPLSREKFIPRFREDMGERIKDEKRFRVDGKIKRVFEFERVTQTCHELL